MHHLILFPRERKEGKKTISIETIMKEFNVDTHATFERGGGAMHNYYLDAHFLIVHGVYREP